MPEHNAKKIVVAGASGLIGTHLVKALSQRGDYVTALVRDVDASRQSLHGANEILPWTSQSISGA